MKILILTLFVCVVNGASLSGGNSAAAASGSGDRTPNPVEAAAQVATAPAMAAKAVASSAATITGTAAARTSAAPATAVAAPVATAIATPVAASEAVAKASATASAQASATAVAEASASAVASDANTLASGEDATAAGKSGSSSSDGDAEIVRYEAEVRTDGFSYSYETSNGIAAESTGDLKKVNETEVIVMKGSYKYTDKDGNAVSLTYVADENGFQPESNILPTAPPIPEDIARAIAYILSQIKAGEKTDESKE